MPFDQTPERRGGGDDDFTFTLDDDLEAGHRCLVVLVNYGIALAFTAPTDMPKGTECSVTRFGLASGVDYRVLAYRLTGIAAQFIIVAEVVRQ